jgi:gliding motility-associated-like protein
MRLFIVLTFWGMFSSAYSQSPPEVCARLLLGSGMDSIGWQASPCPSFGGYVLLGQINNSGPFVALDTLFSTTTTHPNSTETFWNYQVGMLCGGVLSNLSAVVSNQRPITPDMNAVSIVNNLPQVSWQASPSPEVIGYQLYKENPYGSGNYFPYPSNNTIINGLSFDDITASSLLVRYALVAVSACNKSLLGIGNAIDGTTGPHSSMLVDGSIDSCQQEINLNWNAYENWAEGVEAYEILVSSNGGSFSVHEVVGGNNLNYTYSQANDGELLLFRIRAIERNRNNSAYSNELRFEVETNRPMDYIHLTQVSVNAAQQVELTWTWDTDVDFDFAQLYLGSDSNSLTNTQTFNGPLTSSNNYLHTTISTNSTQYFYRLESTDLCQLVQKSNLGSSLFLKAEALDDFENQLSWSTAFMQYGTVQSYDLFQINNGSAQLLANLGPNELAYTDVLDISNQSEADKCYVLKANMLLGFPNGQSYYSINASNKVCVQQSSTIYTPNALSPSGENRFFKPLMVFSNSVQNYSMQIFDRYGGLLFETSDLSAAWDGTKNGSPLAMGNYVYAIRFQEPNGNWVEKKGNVLLIR